MTLSVIFRLWFSKTIIQIPMLLKTNEFSNITETLLTFYHFLSFFNIFYHKVIAFVFLVPCVRINFLLYVCLLIIITQEWVFIKTTLHVNWVSIDKWPSSIVRSGSSLLHLVFILVHFPNCYPWKTLFITLRNGLFLTLKYVLNEIKIEDSKRYQNAGQNIVFYQLFPAFWNVSTLAGFLESFNRNVVSKSKSSRKKILYVVVTTCSV